jgi:adenosylcobyric acid synthase
MVLGICGGFQMLGEKVADPQGIEGPATTISGLGLLPIQTVMYSQKVTQQRTTQSRPLPPIFGADTLWGEFQGYEIHQGVSELSESGATAVDFLFTDTELGIASRNVRVMGTYLHDLFSNGAWRRMWLNQLRVRKGLPPLNTDIPNYDVQRNQQLDRITDAIAPHLDLTTFF